MAELSPEFLQYCVHEFGRSWDALTEDEKRIAVDNYGDFLYHTSS